LTAREGPGARLLPIHNALLGDLSRAVGPAHLEAEHISKSEGPRAGRFHRHLRRNRPSSAHVADSVRDSPARAQPHDASAWLPLPAPDALPPVADAPERPVESEAVDAPEPAARAEPPAPAQPETSWLPVPDMTGVPSIHELLQPQVTAPAPLPVGTPSPARAEPHDATAWLPLPEVDGLPHISELVEPDAKGKRSKPRRHRRFHVHIPVRSLLVLLVVMATAFGLYWGTTRALDPGDDVALHVDGKLVSAQTGVSTVASFLKEEKVSLGEHDRVVPAPTTPIQDGMSVRVLRAFAVPVDYDGVSTTMYATRSDPQDFLKDLNLPKDVVLRDPPARITAATPVALRTKHAGTLYVDNGIINYNSPSATVQELLATSGVILGPQDYTVPAADSKLGPSVSVFRVAQQTDTVSEPYTLPDERQPDPNMDVSEADRAVAGKPGLQNVTYEVTNENGKESGRVAISKVPTTPAVPNITYYGTKYNPLWDKMANCETGGNWAATGQKYQGGLGIYFQNWNYYGGRKFAPIAGQATKYEQIIVAEKIQHDHGWHAWGCAKTIGL
jgi:uncharacterized protein YabE (DUF348 family)